MLKNKKDLQVYKSKNLNNSNFDNFTLNDYQVYINLIAKLGNRVPATSRSAVTIQTNAYFSRNALRLSNSKMKIKVKKIVIPMVTLSIYYLPSYFLCINDKMMTRKARNRYQLDLSTFWLGEPNSRLDI